MNLNQHLKFLDEKYLMKFRGYNIDMLDMFIDTYLLCVYDFKIISLSEKRFQRDFHNWVKEYYSAPKDRSWSSTILYYEASHRVAIEKFFKLYKQWYKEEFGEDAW